MAEKQSHNSLKRPFIEEETSDKQSAQKKVRFPKGKKVKSGSEVVEDRIAGTGKTDLKDPRRAAKERAHRRNQITADLLNEESEGFLNDVSTAEETYEEESHSDDGIQMEPFNLNKEREEGYFDADGNFVEYLNEKEIKDAWLDSIEANPKYIRGVTAANQMEEDEEDENGDTNVDLTSNELGVIKRRIANVLEPGETVLQALRRLKGNSNNRKEKMSAGTKRIFDQLTEDADKLIQDGEYNVYHEKQEAFKREAEGYERLVNVKENEVLHMASTSSDVSQSLYSDANVGPGSGAGNSMSGLIATEIPDSGDYDMFADDDEQVARDSGPSSSTVLSPSGAQNKTCEAGAPQYNNTADGSDYAYDEASGYYYSSSLNYYYDPTTGLYCSAATGQWYSFNEETGVYEEVREVSSTAS